MVFLVFFIVFSIVVFLVLSRPFSFYWFVLVFAVLGLVFLSAAPVSKLCFVLVFFGFVSFACCGSIG